MEKPNKYMFARVMNHILEYPDTWDQTRYHCGTSHCFAGHAQIISVGYANPFNTQEDAMRALNISYVFAGWLFGVGRTMAELYEVTGAVLYDAIDFFGKDRQGNPWWERYRACPAVPRPVMPHLPVFPEDSNHA